MATIILRAVRPSLPITSSEERIEASALCAPSPAICTVRSCRALSTLCVALAPTAEGGATCSPVYPRSTPAYLVGTDTAFPCTNAFARTATLIAAETQTVIKGPVAALYTPTYADNAAYAAFPSTPTLSTTSATASASMGAKKGTGMAAPPALGSAVAVATSAPATPVIFISSTPCGWSYGRGAMGLALARLPLAPPLPTAMRSSRYYFSRGLAAMARTCGAGPLAGSICR